jgi:hypothetical protein
MGAALCYLVSASYAQVVGLSQVCTEHRLVQSDTPVAAWSASIENRASLMLSTWN